MARRSSMAASASSEAVKVTFFSGSSLISTLFQNLGPDEMKSMDLSGTSGRRGGTCLTCDPEGPGAKITEVGASAGAREPPTHLDDRLGAVLTELPE